MDEFGLGGGEERLKAEGAAWVFLLIAVDFHDFHTSDQTKTNVFHV